MTETHYSPGDVIINPESHSINDECVYFVHQGKV
jgi:phage repressor protein C with HTH and peptisase S24 domain